MNPQGPNSDSTNHRSGGNAGVLTTPQVQAGEQSIDHDDPWTAGSAPERRVSAAEEAFTRRTLTTTMLTIAALTFAFSFGNVWSLGLRLGVAPWLAPLIGPAVDLSVIGLIVGIRHLALCGVRAAELRPARVLLAFSGLATLALNIAEPAAPSAVSRSALSLR